jgi:addiction module HigA family antidote
MKMTKYLKNPHPGEILQEEFLEPLGLSQNALAQAIGVPSNRINDIVRGRRGITADTDLRFARYFELSEGYWLRLQNSYDLMDAQREAGKAISLIKPFPVHEHEGVFA